MATKTTTYSNNITGEIYSNKSEEVNYFNDKGYLFMLNKNYSRVFDDIRISDQVFNDSELGKIYRLQAHIQKDTNMVIKRTKKGYRAMTLLEIIEIVKLADRQGRYFVQKLIDNKIIAKVTVELGSKVETQYYFNPLYFHNSKRLNRNLYNLFKNELDQYLKPWVKEMFKNED